MQKKSLLFAFGAMALPCFMASAQIGVASQDLNHSVIYPGLVEIDINGDGILDLIYSGEVRDANISGRLTEDAEGNESFMGNNTFQMVWNSATGKYEFSEFPFYFANKAYFAVADWNGNGLTDFYVTGEASMAFHGVEFGMFLNNGDGTFTRTQINVIDENGAPIDYFDPRCVDVADFNSDGRLDMVVSGWKEHPSGDVDDEGNSINIRNPFNMVLINKGDLTFQATNTELLMWGNNPYEFALNLLQATDLNNDGYADFLVTGNVDNADPADLPLTAAGVSVGRAFVAALNIGADGLYNGTPILYDLGLAQGVAHQYGHGGILAFDYDNDGVMDILVGGESPNDVYPDGTWDYNWQLLKGRISSDGSVSYTDVTSSTAFASKDIRPLNDNNPVRAIDYNGNGYYDLFIPGWCTTMLDETDATQAGWFFPNNNGSLAGYERVPGSSECAVFFTENGVSGARNYGFLGQSWDGLYFNDEGENVTGKMMLFTNNPYNKASRPDAPASAVASANGSNVTLEWTPAASSLSNVTYDYYIKDKSTGTYYRGVTAHVGGDKDGVRTTLAQGRAFMATKLNLVGLPQGDYEWGVQTVNAGLEGSVFCKGNDFKIGEDAGVNVIESNSPVVETVYYDITGRKLNNAPLKGIYIKKDIRENGKTSVTKVVL